MKKLLITGVTGLIGSSVLREILKRNLDFIVHALVRPDTDSQRFQEFSASVKLTGIDLSDLEQVRSYLLDFQPDVVLHIGALRGGRKFSKEIYYRTNVLSTQVMIQYCLDQGAELIFCSSVGVFGAIPNELPANNYTEKVGDNYYHYTKIEAEKLINRAILNGLKGAILRPAITYGRGDFGFPFQLVKMVHRHQLPLVRKRIWIHLCHIETITEAFIWLLLNEYPNGLTLCIADREPVQFRDLVNFVSRSINNKNYPSILNLDIKIFSFLERVFTLLKNELWISRIQLISKTWFYDVSKAYELMNIPEHYTIPDFKMIVDAYFEHRGAR